MMQLEDIPAGVHYSVETKKTLIGFRLKFTIESESGVQSYGIFVKVENFKTVEELTHEICRRFNVKYSENLRVFIDEFEVPPEESILVLTGVDRVKIQSKAISSQSGQNGDSRDLSMDCEVRRGNSGQNGDSRDLSVDCEGRRGNSKRSEDMTKRPRMVKASFANRGLAGFLRQLKENDHGARSAERVENEDTTCDVAKDSHSVHTLAIRYEKLRNKVDDNETSVTYPVENANQNDNAMELDEECDLSSAGMQSSQISSAHDSGAVENDDGFETSSEKARRKRKRKHSKKKKESVAVDEVDRVPNKPPYKREFLVRGTGKHTFFKDSEEPQDLDPTNIYKKDVNRTVPGKGSPQDLDPTDIYKKDVNGRVPSSKSQQDLDPTDIYKKDVNGRVPSSKSPQDLDPTDIYKKDVNGRVPSSESPQDLDPTNLYKKNIKKTVPSRESPQDLAASYVYREDVNGTIAKSQELPVPTSKPTYVYVRRVNQGIITSDVPMDYVRPVSKGRMIIGRDENLGQLLMFRDLKTRGLYDVEFGEGLETESSSLNSSRIKVIEENSLVPKTHGEAFTSEKVSTVEKRKVVDDSVGVGLGTDVKLIDGVIHYKCSSGWRELTEENASRDLTSVTKPKVNQMIAFKVLYLDSNSEPQMSPFIVGKVTKCSDQTVCMEIQPVFVTPLTRELDGELPHGMYDVNGTIYELEWTAMRDSVLLCSI